MLVVEVTFLGDVAASHYGEWWRGSSFERLMEV